MPHYLSMGSREPPRGETQMTISTNSNGDTIRTTTVGCSGCRGTGSYTADFTVGPSETHECGKCLGSGRVPHTFIIETAAETEWEKRLETLRGARGHFVIGTPEWDAADMAVSSHYRTQR
jgi:DnaJ-class molecular chaperone